MEDLSLHILDLVENSIQAGATRVEILVAEEPGKDQLTIKIKDNGKGMDAETQSKVLDPFFTTRTTRRVGLGLSLFRQAARETGGDMTIVSEPGKGTLLEAVFQFSHIDRKPLGNLAETLMTLVTGNPDITFVFEYRGPEGDFRLDTSEIKE
ncbi:ATP-binding protein [bacterium]|nr:ATP-binding protein [bacterium]